MMEWLTKHAIIVVMSVSSISGLAYLLSKDEKLPFAKTFSAFVLSAVAGLVSYLLFYEIMVDRPAALMAASILMGIGGASTIEFLVLLVRFNIKKIKKL
tara:strand:+ start:2080 stop:2376 length:297 start_codon:yes stop_codon:yes gene_type:complete